MIWNSYASFELSSGLKLGNTLAGQACGSLRKLECWLQLSRGGAERLVSRICFDFRGDFDRPDLFRIWSFANFKRLATKLLSLNEDVDEIWMFC